MGDCPRHPWRLGKSPPAYVMILHTACKFTLVMSKKHLWRHSLFFHTPIGLGHNRAAAKPPGSEAETYRPNAPETFLESRVAS